MRAVDVGFGRIYKPASPISFFVVPDVGFCIFAGKANIGLLKLIPLGLTFSDEDGNLPPCGTDKFCILRFNFREFNPVDDVFANDSIELLRQSWIDFEKNSERSVDALHFAELLMSLRIVLNDAVHWVTFHSDCDFGYLLKLLTCQNLPDVLAIAFMLLTCHVSSSI